MSIKIIGGQAKGITLASPNSTKTRPTSVLLKRRLFDAFQSMKDLTFIDLCAGIGSVGLEASSRGASVSIFVESDKKISSILSKNIKLIDSKLSIGKRILIKKDVFSWLLEFKNLYQKQSLVEQQNTILFFDPPYENIEMYEKFAEVLTWYKGRVLVEACRQKTMHEDKLQALLFEAKKCYRQGTSYIIVGDFREND